MVGPGWLGSLQRGQCVLHMRHQHGSVRVRCHFPRDRRDAGKRLLYKWCILRRKKVRSPEAALPQVAFRKVRLEGHSNGNCRGNMVRAAVRSMKCRHRIKRGTALEAKGGARTHNQCG